MYTIIVQNCAYRACKLIGFFPSVFLAFELGYFTHCLWYYTNEDQLLLDIHRFIGIKCIFALSKETVQWKKGRNSPP